MPRMKQNLPPLTQDLIDAFIASAGLWLARLMALLFNPRAAARKRMLTRLVQFGERLVEYVLFCAAAHRLGALTRPRRITSRIIERPGFRIAQGDNRLLWKSARIRLRNATLIARVGRLLEALANPAAYVAHYMKRLARGLCFRRLVACAPARVAFTSAEAAAVAYADSS
jgi:hypothetical protein